MKRYVAAVVAVVISVVAIAAIAGAFNASEQTVIQQLKARITALEKKVADLPTRADLDAVDGRVSAAVESINTDITSLFDNEQAMAADIDTLIANDQTLDAAVKTLDSGLKGIVSETGPLAQLNGEILGIQDYVYAKIPPITLSNITPTVVCDGTNCTVDVSWDSDPAATGQVEWGKTLAYGSLTKLQADPLTYHKQRLGTLPQDGTVYHFRVLATTPDQSAAPPDITFVAQ
jgi:hypothetical protein